MIKIKPIILVTALAASYANAATIAWTASSAPVEGGFGQTLSTGLFDTTGTEILAENVGGAAGSFDGINWDAGTVTFAGGTADLFHDTQFLSDQATYGNTGSDTVSLTGLTIGNTYRIQALVYDGRGAAGIPGRTVSFDGVNQGQYANGVNGVTWGDGLLVTGTFVADAVNQDFTIEAFEGATSRGGQLNALLVHETAVVPEPSSFALLGLGGLALLRRKRR